uniref:Uncharacterized protein n=1 Tax=Anguilla anguilla TaxID=7936 RepID=A0A0E9RCV6_ANGAN
MSLNLFLDCDICRKWCVKGYFGNCKIIIGGIKCSLWNVVQLL